jgi:RNA polymerase sigma factor (TIGR02999 family)
MAREITDLILELRAGGDGARQKLMDAVYAELHRIASAHLRHERPGHTLQPTALVHEAYLRIFGAGGIEFADRAHFFAVASQVMRRILVDHARQHTGRRRGGDMQRVELPPDETAGEIGQAPNDQSPDILDLDSALDDLARDKPSLARVIEMHYFAGMTAEEIAEAAGRSVFVIRHDIRFARAWLGRALTGSARRDPSANL